MNLKEVTHWNLSGFSFELYFVSYSRKLACISFNLNKIEILLNMLTKRSRLEPIFVCSFKLIC